MLLHCLTRSDRATAAADVFPLALAPAHAKHQTVAVTHPLLLAHSSKQLASMTATGTGRRAWFGAGSASVMPSALSSVTGMGVVCERR